MIETRGLALLDGIAATPKTHTPIGERSKRGPINKSAFGVRKSGIPKSVWAPAGRGGLRDVGRKFKSRFSTAPRIGRRQMRRSPFLLSALGASVQHSLIRPRAALGSRATNADRT